MKLEYAKNPIWSNPNHTTIDLIIKWEDFNEEFPFTASPNDCEQHGREIYAAAVRGDYGPIEEYVAPPPIPEPTPQQKLAAAGLSVDELKQLLGL